MTTLPGRGRLDRARPLLCLFLITVVAVACGNATPSPSPSPTPIGTGPLASAPASGEPASGAPPSAGPSATPVAATPTPAAFWTKAAAALTRTGRLKVVLARPDPLELHFEPKASAALVKGALSAVCVDRTWYQVQGHHATAAPGPWACGSSALITGFRRLGQPMEAYNTSLPPNTVIREMVTADPRTWQWTYTARSTALGGAVRTTLVLDLATGRLISGQRIDPRGTTQYSFNYTAIFAPVALP